MLVKEIQKRVGKKIATKGATETLVATIKPKRGRPKKEESKVEKLPLKVGAFVLIKNQVNSLGENTQMISFREKSFPGVVHYISEPYVYVMFDIDIASNPINMCPSYNLDGVEVISESDFRSYRAKAIKKHKELMEKLVGKNDNMLSKVILPHVPIEERTGKDYLFSSRPFLNSNYNFVGLQATLSSLPTKHYNAGCCALTKTTSHVRVWMPKLWMDYYGYSEDDLKEWLSFVEGCGIRFNADYIGKTTIGKAFSQAPTIPTKPNYANNNYFMYSGMEAYEILIHAGKTTMITYLYFILMRYMYNYTYWNIPFIAMKLKKNLGDKATNWECLLLAHANEVYNGYYCLVANSNSNVVLPTSANSQTNVLQKLSSGSYNMNTSYNYTSTFMSSISELIRKDDYAGILKKLEAWRKL